MEKRKPHCPLERVKALAADGHARVTKTALEDGGLLGFDRDGIIEVVMSLKREDFYKSMTTYNDHKIWQDVYQPMTHAGEVYLKLTVIEDVLVVSFKEL